MAKTLITHSFRHGVGRSSMVVNMAVAVAVAGQRVGILDADAAAPTLHGLLGLDESHIKHSFDDFLSGRCNLDQAAISLTDRLGRQPAGALYFLPGVSAHSPVAAPDPSDPAARVSLLNTGCQTLVEQLQLDVLFIDMQPGHGEKALALLTIADVLVLVLRHDWRDYQGTSVTIELVRQLDIPGVGLILNEVPNSFDADNLRRELYDLYQCDVCAVVPHVDELMALGNQDIFVLHYPTHPVTHLLAHTVNRLLTGEDAPSL